MTTALQEKAQWLSEIYAAVAKGETLQFFNSAFSRWEDTQVFPTVTSNPAVWRIKPKPRTQTFWVWLNNGGEIIDVTQHQRQADEWRAAGHNVIETTEVLS